MRAWRHWYHVTGGTYGTWLPGDERGWRSRHHKRHVDGDYHDPPPEGMHAGLAAYSAGRMNRPPVYLDPDQRRIVAMAMAERLQQLALRPLVVSMGACHFHVLAQFMRDDPRPMVGLAKQHARFALGSPGFAGGMWAKGSHPIPIADRAHQLRAFRYILDHRKEGAYVWTFRDGAPGRSK